MILPSALAAVLAFAAAASFAQPAWKPEKPIELVVTRGHVQVVPASVGLWVTSAKVGQVRLLKGMLTDLDLVKK